MPATAGRVRMPANNRAHSSAALQTHGIWQSAIGYDPYAPDQKNSAAPSSAAPGGDDASAGTGDGLGSRASEQNTYDSFQGLLALARLTGSNADEARGSCRKCGRVGHLAFQCRNMLALKEEAITSSALASAHGSSILSPFADKHGLGRVTKRKDKDGNVRNYSSSDDGDDDSEDDASDVSDSSEDSDMERYIREKFGRNPLKSSSSKSKASSKKELSESNKRKKKSHSSSKRSRSKKDLSDDDDDDVMYVRKNLQFHVYKRSADA